MSCVSQGSPRIWLGDDNRRAPVRGWVAEGGLERNINVFSHVSGGSDLEPGQGRPFLAGAAPLSSLAIVLDCLGWSRLTGPRCLWDAASQDAPCDPCAGQGPLAVQSSQALHHGLRFTCHQPVLLFRTL